MIDRAKEMRDLPQYERDQLILAGAGTVVDLRDALARRRSYREMLKASAKPKGTPHD